MYEVWESDGSGAPRKVRFKRREDALRYIDHYAGTGSLAMRNPDGTWHTWHATEAVIRNRRKAPRVPTTGACMLDPTPGRHGERRTLRCALTDASEEGLGLEVPDDLELLARDLVWLSIADGAIEVPARVAWRDGPRTGLQLHFPDAELQARFGRWLRQQSAR